MPMTVPSILRPPLLGEVRQGVVGSTVMLTVLGVPALVEIPWVAFDNGEARITLTFNGVDIPIRNVFDGPNAEHDCLVEVILPNDPAIVGPFVPFRVTISTPGINNGWVVMTFADSPNFQIIAPARNPPRPIMPAG